MMALSRGTAAALVMHYENLPKSAGTAYRRVAVSSHHWWRETKVDWHL